MEVVNSGAALHSLIITLHISIAGVGGKSLSTQSIVRVEPAMPLISRTSLNTP